MYATESEPEDRFDADFLESEVRGQRGRGQQGEGSCRGCWGLCCRQAGAHGWRGGGRAPLRAATPALLLLLLLLRLSALLLSAGWLPAPYLGTGVRGRR